MSAVEERRVMTPHTLAGHIEEFMSSNRYSNYVDHRWLTSYLEEALQVVRQVRSDNLDGKWRTAISLFRLKELNEQRLEKLKEIETIEREAKTLEVQS